MVLSFASSDPSFSLSSQTTPRTLIAICGTTGSGKSSVINALLDDTIVPTSGMRACTAVVTEISYKPGPSIEADVSFLTRDEWRDELRILIDDLTENNGGLKKVADSRGDETSVSLSKVSPNCVESVLPVDNVIPQVHALYPNLPQAELIHLTPDEVINRYPTVACYLDSTRKIEAGNSSEFAKAIGRYIDSKETKGRKRHDGKKKSDEPAVGDSNHKASLVTHCDSAVASDKDCEDSLLSKSFGDRCCARRSTGHGGHERRSL